MLATKTSTQLNSKQKTLIEIAVNITERLAPIEAASINVSRIKDYQIWRDRHNVAIVNIRTHKLVVFGTVKPQLDREDIISQDLWKSIHHYYGDFSPIISHDEIESAWQFLRPLDPTILNLYQSQPNKPSHSITTATQENANRTPKIKRMSWKLERLRSIFCLELSKSAV